MTNISIPTPIEIPCCPISYWEGVLKVLFETPIGLIALTSIILFIVIELYFRKKGY